MDESANDVFTRASVAESEYISTDGMGEGGDFDGPVSSEDIAKVAAEYEAE